MTEEKNIGTDPRFYLANERTFLAWVRTSIAIIALGFVVVKFSLFIRQLFFLAGKNPQIPQRGYSNIIGILLVVSGAIILLLAFIKYKRTNRELTAGGYKSTSKLITALTVALLITAFLLIWYLFSNSKQY